MVVSTLELTVDARIGAHPARGWLLNDVHVQRKGITTHMCVRVGSNCTRYCHSNRRELVTLTDRCRNGGCYCKGRPCCTSSQVTCYLGYCNPRHRLHWVNRKWGSRDWGKGVGVGVGRKELWRRRRKGEEGHPSSLHSPWKRVQTLRHLP